MSVRTCLRATATTAVVAATAIFAAAPAALAAPADAAAASLAVSVGELIVSPAEDRGYAGSLPVTVENQGTEPVSPGVTVIEPVPGSFDAIPNEAVVYNGFDEAGRLIILGGVPGSAIEPGERREFSIEFLIRTAPRDRAMVATGGRLTIQTADVQETAEFGVLFRSTGGSVANPVPYVQDTKAAVSVTASPATLIRQEDGTFTGRASVAVHYASDAAHFGLSAAVVLPTGVDFHGTDPSEACTDVCMVPGGRFLQGETRVFELLLSAPADTESGSLGSASVEVTTDRNGEVPEEDAADNTAAIEVTVVEAN
jgi:hypothetical protein